MESVQYHLSKAQCKKHLAPFLDMLEDQRRSTSIDRWLAQLSKTESSILQSPGQYVGSDLADLEMTIRIVREIFRDFRASILQYA